MFQAVARLLPVERGNKDCETVFDMSFVMCDVYVFDDCDMRLWGWAGYVYALGGGHVGGASCVTLSSLLLHEPLGMKLVIPFSHP